MVVIAIVDVLDDDSAAGVVDDACCSDGEHAAMVTNTIVRTRERLMANKLRQLSN